MNISTNNSNELKASEAFTKQSKIFDRLYTCNEIIQYKRQRVREHILYYARQNGFMLELNCGTGDDALFFASKGFRVHATDISSGMLEQLNRKVQYNSCENRISMEQCSFTELNSLKSKQSFDYVYSNFGGLNCTTELETVLHSFDRLLKPGGVVTLVIISKFCLWESLLVFKGRFKTAFRRFFAQKGKRAHIEGNFFKCWYYSPSFVKKKMKNNYEFLGLEGLCAMVPPSYIENFTTKHPRFFRFLREQENKLKSKWPWNRMGDYFIISFKRKQT